MNPLFGNNAPLRGTLGPNPVIMDKQQLDVLRMLVQGYGQNQAQPAIMGLINRLTPAQPLREYPGPVMSGGIRG